MFKRISKEIKEEILGRVTEGKFSVPKLAEQYAMSPKTIYSWLRNNTEETNISAVEFNKLKRENDELKRIIGIVTLQLEREKKGKVGPLGR
jgi:transposase-like protein